MGWPAGAGKAPWPHRLPGDPMSTSTQSHPDLIIAIPGIQRFADQRWLVHLWCDEEPCRANFRHYISGRIDVNHQAEWAAGGWVAPIPVEIPPKLAARARKELLRLNRRSKRLVAPSPVDRFASARARRREAAIGQRPRLWRQA